MIVKFKLKICGMRDPDNIREVIKYHPDYLGFIFYNGSPRYVGDHLNQIQKVAIPTSIKKIPNQLNKLAASLKKKREATKINKIRME